MALSRLTITRLRLIESAPLARHTETIIGSVSGVRPTATATATAKKKASFQSWRVRPLTRKTSGTMTAMKRTISHVNRSTPRSKLVCGWRPTIVAAMVPK
jgi:hypothetical protein